MENIDLLKTKIWTDIGQQEQNNADELRLEGYIRPEM